MDLICPECMGTLELRDGGTARCKIHGGEFQVLFSRYTAAALSQAAQSGSSSIPEGCGDIRCVQHPHIHATGQCKSCGAFMCNTCAFELPGGIKICPTCATSPKTTISPKRKKALVSSFVLAIWCTAVMGALMGGLFRPMITDEASQQALGMLLIFILLVPSIIGTALGVSSMERRMNNTMAMWIATIWNGLILVGFILLMIIGIMKGG